MLVKDKKYAVAVSDMQGWRISELQDHAVKEVLRDRCRAVIHGMHRK